MNFDGIVFSAGFYFVLSLQVYFGFPPFYKRVFFFEMVTEEEEFRAILPQFLFGGVSMAASVGVAEWEGYSAFCLIGVAALLATGWSIRAKLKKETGGPLPWLLVYTAAPPVSSFLDRLPMFVFDLWTIGFSGIIALMFIVFGQY